MQDLLTAVVNVIVPFTFPAPFVPYLPPVVSTTYCSTGAVMAEVALEKPENFELAEIQQSATKKVAHSQISQISKGTDGKIWETIEN